MKQILLWSGLIAIGAGAFVALVLSRGKARISFYYQGVDQLMSLARRKLDDNHA